MHACMHSLGLCVHTAHAHTRKHTQRSMSLIMMPGRDWMRRRPGRVGVGRVEGWAKGMGGWVDGWVGWMVAPRNGWVGGFTKVDN
jgi:hypothetical protein